MQLVSTGSSYGYYGSQCMMKGKLTSTNQGRMLKGTLSAAGNAGSTCGSLEVSLVRNQ